MASHLSKLPFIIVLLLAACTLPQTQAQQTTAAAHITYNTPPLAAQSEAPPTKGNIPPNIPTLKVALLLPLSGDSSTVGNAMLDAATMAVSDAYFTASASQIHTQVVLLPKDTGNSGAMTRAALQQAIDEGAGVIIGPLFSVSVTAVTKLAQDHNIPVISFSNNGAVAQKGVYTFGFMPEEQIKRMSEYAYLHNLQRVALLAPNDLYGAKIKDTLTTSYNQKGGTVGPVELYASSAVNIEAAVARMAAAYNNAKDDRRFQAIFIADSGNEMRNIVDALKKSHLDLSKIKLIGTGLWDDPNLSKIPELTGAWFPNSASAPYQIFERRFTSTYGYKPIRLASLSYDAVSLIADLSMPTNGSGITNAMLTDPKGFMGPANGLYRLDGNGISERKLAIMEVTPDGGKVIDPVPNHF